MFLQTVFMKTVAPKLCKKIPSFLVTNACHVTNKVDELASVIELNNADITIVTESWLSDNIP